MATLNQFDLTILDNIHIAAPCSADWSKMMGDDRSRLCGECHKHVYDLTVMSPEAAVDLIREREGNICVRMYKRSDGRLIAGNCPVGARAVMWRTGRLVIACASAALVGLMLLVIPKAFARRDHSDSRVMSETKRLIDDTLIWIGLRRPPVVMGGIACPPTPVTPATSLELEN